MDSTISGLSAASALTGSEPFPVDQSGSTLKATANQIKSFVNALPLLIGSQANTTKYPTALEVLSDVTTADVENHMIGFASERTATFATNGSTPLTGWGIGVYGKGWTNGGARSVGVVGEGMVTLSTDTGSAIGVRGYSVQTHAGGTNIGVYGNATGGSSNFDFYSLNGTMTSATGTLSVSSLLNATGINSTPIGATTPSTGAFTTLTASGSISSSDAITTTSGGAAISAASGYAILGATTVGSYAPTGAVYVSGTTLTHNCGTSGYGWNNSANSAQLMTLGGAGNLAVTGNISSTSDANIHGLTVGLGGGGVASNTAVGAGALLSNTTGYYNTATGTTSLYSNTTGYNNTASGYQILYYNTTGNNNTASGLQSLFANTAGVQNTASGVSALYSNTTGNYNAALGYQAGYGAAGVNANTTGSNNTFLGFQTVGAGAADTNEIVIGANAVGLGSNTTVIGSASTTMSNIKGRVLIGTTTDDGVNALQVNGTAKATSIKFANTSGTKQALDYYEAGTWTPSVGGTATYSARSGTYTRIGRRVFVDLDISMLIIGTGSTSNIEGLPFWTAKEGIASTSYFGACATAIVCTMGMINGTSIQLYSLTAAAGSATVVSVIGSGTRLVMSGSYDI